MGRLSAPAFRAVHVRDLSHHQFEGHQQRSEIAARRRGRRMGGPVYGFILATGFAALLFLGLVLNGLFTPADRMFERADRSDYKAG
jgi:hypothetical protein